LYLPGGGWVAYINPAGAGMLGEDDKRVLGRPFSALLHPDYAGIADLEACALEALPVPVMLMRADGRLLFAEIEARARDKSAGTFLVRARDLGPSVRAIAALSRGGGNDRNGCWMPWARGWWRLTRRGRFASAIRRGNGCSAGSGGRRSPML